MQARFGGASRVLMLAVVTWITGCEVRTVREVDSAAAARHTDTVAGTVTTIPGTQRVVGVAGAADSAPASADTAAPAVAPSGTSDVAADSASAASAAPSAAAPSAAAPASAARGAPARGAAARGPAVAGSAMRIEVDVAARRLHVVQGDSETATYPVAVGSKAWPTERGTWTIKQVIINPAWIPPDQSWAEESVPKDPGAPDNPLGRAQLVYDPPRTVHGTDKPTSIGTATSHGSIRMTNEAIVRVAKVVLAASGSDKDAAWVDRALANRHQKQAVDLPHPVPIVVR